jgi:hypothetical protein
MSHRLNKPYTDEQYLNFIVTYNHNQNLRIEETQHYLFALEDNEILDGENAIIDPDYEEKQKQKERERIAHLKCTKRVFVLMLEQLGLDYFEQIEPKINDNRRAKLEWELCVELERSNPLLDEIGGNLGITSEQLDNLFKYANGEITEQEFRGA